tara:strand:+ start:366 stop:476 length:111 start_codon:yes stop_codon:yes gene_type:complete
MNEYKRAEKAAFVVGLAIALSIHLIMNFLYFFSFIG